MKKLLLKIKYRIMPTATLLKMTNHHNFSEREQLVIGSELLRRFDTDEALEAKCTTVLG